MIERWMHFVCVHTTNTARATDEPDLIKQLIHYDRERMSRVEGGIGNLCLLWVREICRLPQRMCWIASHFAATKDLFDNSFTHFKVDIDAKVLLDQYFTAPSVHLCNKNPALYYDNYVVNHFSVLFWSDMLNVWTYHPLRTINPCNLHSIIEVVYPWGDWEKNRNKIQIVQQNSTTNVVRHR